MSGKYVFYIRLNTTGSSIESIRNFSILTNAPGLTFSPGITITGISYTNVIAVHSVLSASNVYAVTTPNTQGYFNRVHSLSGSWVGEILFQASGVSNDASDVAH